MKSNCVSKLKVNQIDVWSWKKKSLKTKNDFKLIVGIKKKRRWTWFGLLFLFWNFKKKN